MWLQLLGHLAILWPLCISIFQPQVASRCTFPMPLKQLPTADARLSTPTSTSTRLHVGACYQRYGIIVIDSSLCTFYDHLTSISTSFTAFPLKGSPQQNKIKKARKSQNRTSFSMQLVVQRIVSSAHMQAKEIKPK